MARTPIKKLFSELPLAALWPPDNSRTPIENLVEFILTGNRTGICNSDMDRRAAEVLRFSPHHLRVVVLGGGTGLSTIVGGNSRMADWPDQPSSGLKLLFPQLTSIVCTTDDGGSTGRLLQSLPIIGVGDLRKLLLSSIHPENLERKYALAEPEALELIRMIHRLFNHRFGEDVRDRRQTAEPLLAIPAAYRTACPRELERSLNRLGAFLSSPSGWIDVLPAGHSLGNLLLTAAIFQEAKGRTDRPPKLKEIQGGIDHIASLIGAPRGRILPATGTPGQLKFRYANGVVVYGQSKSSYARRNCPVDRVTAVFTRPPVVGGRVQKALQEADLVIFAPGSLYTSIIPILQLEPITTAIRTNRKALKVLAANSWIQEGETDISLKNQARGFLISELIEAYDRNIPQGIHGLFDVVLSANLEHIPGNILRNYALEGKSPIHLDRPQVEAMEVHPVEATLFSQNRPIKSRAIHHDPQRFALAIQTLLYADMHLRGKKGWALRNSAPAKAHQTGGSHRPSFTIQERTPLLCGYLESIKFALQHKDFQPAWLRDFFVELAWENRDIHPSHLLSFRGARVLPNDKWNRSTEWDNVLGYFNPEDRFLYLHKNLIGHPSRLKEDLLTALGESLLGRYIEKRRWIRQNAARRYEIVLRPPHERECYLSDAQLHEYLCLSRMIQDPENDSVYGITINKGGGFLPPGLLFGLLYSWYISGRGLTMEYEMSLLRWPSKSLIPLHAMDRIRKESLVRFFRTNVFGHKA